MGFLFISKGQKNKRRDECKMDKQQILENSLSALFPKEEYDAFNAKTQEKAQKLKESMKNFNKEETTYAEYLCKPVYPKP